MSRAERAKGQRGQLAVRRLFESHGWTVTATASSRRSESGTCDLLAMRNGVTLAVEVKNQAVLRLPLWRRQTLANAPEGTVPVLVYREHGVWVANWFISVWWADAASALADDGGAPLVVA